MLCIKFIPRHKQDKVRGRKTHDGRWNGGRHTDKKSCVGRVTKNLIILTQQSRYRKKLKTSKFITTRYFWHKNFVRTIRERPYKYNADLDFVEELVYQKQAIAFYPEISLPKLITRDPKRLRELYKHGYEMGKTVVEQIKEFFGITGETC